MAIKKTINIDINAKSAIKTLDELGGSFEDANGEGAIPLSTTIGELEDRLYAMAAAGDTASKEFNEISGQVGKMKKVIIDTDLTLDGMSQNLTQNVGGALTGVASGFALAQGAMGSFGIGGQAVEESLLKVQSAMAMAQGLQGLKESVSSFKALKKSVMAATIAQKAYAFVTGATTTAMKLLRVALIATGIGAIVLGVIALVTNFKAIVSWVGKIGSKMGGLGKAMKVAFMPVMMLVKGVMMALQALGIIESDEEKANEKRHKKRIKQAHERAEASAKVKAAAKKVYEDEQKNADRLITLAEAQGKSSVELRKQKISDSIAYQKEQIKEMKRSIDLIDMLMKKYKILGDSTEWQDMFKGMKDKLSEAENAVLDSETNLQVIGINSNKKKGEDYKTYLANRLSAERQAKDLAIEIESTEIARNNEKYARLIEDTKNNENLKQSEKDKIIKSYEALRVIAEEKIISDREAKEKASADKIADFKKKADEKFAMDKETFEEKLYQDGIAADDKELAAVDAKYFNLLALAEQYGIDDAEIRARYAAETKVITDKQDEDAKAKAKTIRDEEFAAIDAGFNKAQEVANVIQSMGDVLFDAKLAKVKKGSAEEEKILKKQFQFNKAMQLSLAVIDAGKAITASLAAAPLAIGVVPNPVGIASLAMAGITSAINIAKIAGTQFSSSQTAPPTPDVNLPSGGGASPAFNVVGNTGINQLAEGLGNQDNAPIQAYVVSGDVTTAQSLDRNKIDTATI